MHGDCRDLLRTLPDASIDSIVTDPPYELGFMGKSWDSTGIAYQVDVWRECLRVLKHGGHLLAFGGSRTYHRLACAIEDAGFQIRDQIMWVYGSGFPKSLNISKAIDKTENPETWENNAYGGGNSKCEECGKWMISGSPCKCPKPVVEYKTAEAKQWEGWGTALKPAHEPIVLARKPLDGTVAQNVLWYGTGALNINECRVHRAEDDVSIAGHRTVTFGTQETSSGGDGSGGWSQNDAGRFPANFIHDGSDEVLEMFPQAGGGFGKRGKLNGGATNWGFDGHGQTVGYGDSGSAARFFYCAKASKTDRNEGLNDFAPKRDADRIATDGAGGENPRNRTNTAKVNHHPTVKPTTLMRYLIRLVTPPDGTVLDPFTGSGSTGKAAILEGFKFVGIEQDADYVRIAESRIKYAEQHHEG
jgi:DNA modification methylase